MQESSDLKRRLVFSTRMFSCCSQSCVWPSADNLPGPLALQRDTGVRSVQAYPND